MQTKAQHQTNSHHYKFKFEYTLHTITYIYQIYIKFKALNLNIISYKYILYLQCIGACTHVFPMMYVTCIDNWHVYRKKMLLDYTMILIIINGKIKTNIQKFRIQFHISEILN